MTLAGRSIHTGDSSLGNERYLTKGRIGQLVEVITLTLRDSMLRPLLGSASDRYLPYLMTLFFFILFNNLLGPLPLLDLQGFTPFGRGEVKLQVEMNYGLAGAWSEAAPAWTDVSGQLGNVRLTMLPSGLEPGNEYRWRARVLYSPVLFPGHVASRWFRIDRNR